MRNNTGVPASPSSHSRAEPEEVSALRVPNAALADLIYQSVRFSLWAAGEGLSPCEGEDAEAPDEFFYRYSCAAGDDLWETVPERLAQAFNTSERRFLDAIQERTPNGERIIVQYHPNGDWFVAASASGSRERGRQRRDAHNSPPITIRSKDNVTG